MIFSENRFPLFGIMRGLRFTPVHLTSGGDFPGFYGAGSGTMARAKARRTAKAKPAGKATAKAKSAKPIQVNYWPMAGIGPMAGQVHHFRNYAKETLTYAINRYVDEVNRLYGVMNLRLKDREFIAGKYSIADMAIVGWANGWERQGQDINQFPHLKRWLETMKARPPAQRGLAL